MNLVHYYPGPHTSPGQIQQQLEQAMPADLEGFGLTIAEAMAAGLPVVVTAYSGNMDFCRADNSYRIGYQLTPVGPNPVYPAKAQ